MAVSALHGHPTYETLRQLGAGQFGSVVLARHKPTNREVAVKVLQLDDVNFHAENVQKEILNHRLLLHNHIVEFYEVFIHHHYLCIVMEYCNGGSLYDYLIKRGPLPEYEARWFFQQLVAALWYSHLHAQVVNRDLKLENLLLRTYGNKPFPLLKVCDFGYSKHLNSDSAPMTKVGTAAYVAPEVINNSESRTKYDGQQADIWSCGVVLFVLLVGMYPFTGRTIDNEVAVGMVRNLTQQAVDQTLMQQANLTVECKRLLRGLLSVDSATRYGLQHICQDPWFLIMCPDITRFEHREPRCLQSPEQIRHIVLQAKSIADKFRARVLQDVEDAALDEQFSDDERGFHCNGL